MAETKNQTLKITTLLYAVIAFLYGLNYLFFPELQIKMSGTETIHPAWIRWFGGAMIALGYGSFMIYRNPVKQGIFVSALCVGTPSLD